MWRYLPAMAIETMPLRELLQSLGPALKVANLNFATNACDEIENLKKEDPAMLNASAGSLPTHVTAPRKIPIEVHLCRGRAGGDGVGKPYSLRDGGYGSGRPA